MQKRITKILGLFLGILLLIGLFSVYSNYANLGLNKNSLSNFSCGTLTNVRARSASFNNLAKLTKPLLFFDKNLQNKLSLLSDANILVPQLKYFLGCDQERTFLVLLQDNAELRPSGGFWGSYGVLKVKSGKITSFVTANSFDLDIENQGKFEAPSSTEGIFEEQWRFWNSNWWPDFKISADQGLFFMNKVRPDDKFDAVIGANVDYLLELLKISGDVKVPDYAFSVNSQNFVQKMIYEPSNPAIFKEKGQDPQYLNPADKKPLLAELAKNIIEQIISMHKETDFGMVTYRALNDQNMVIYSFDPNRQAFLSRYLWTGQIATDKNIALVTDANVGSKLDFFVDKNAKTKKVGPGEYEMTLEYQNSYSATSKTLPYSIYRNYLRIFLPKDSSLVSYTGGESNAQLIEDEKMNLSAVKVLLVVSPGQTKTFKFRWRVPKQYETQGLEVLKQSGSRLLINR